MAYYSENEVMQASFAERIGQLLTQYEHSKPKGSNERYDATHALVLAQALLTSCWELILNKRLESINDWSKKKLDTDIPDVCGLRIDMVNSNFPGEILTLREVVEHLRHAVCHPLYLKDNDNSQKTGFSATKKDGQIWAFKFFHSPDFQKNKNMNIISKLKDEKLMDAGLQRRIKVRLDKLKLPRAVQPLLTKEEFDDRVELHYGGILLVRVFEIEIPIKNLKLFVRALSAMLSDSLKESLEEFPQLDKATVAL